MTLQSDYSHTSNHLHHELLDVLDELFFYLVKNYHMEIVQLIDGLIENMNISDEVKHAIFPQLVWWGTFCSPMGLEQTSIYRCYLQKNKQELSKKTDKLQEILVKWQHLSPGFFYVNDAEIEVKGVYYLSNVLEGNKKLLTVNREPFPPPKPGDMLTGLLLPMEEDYYMALGSLYRIPKGLAPKISRAIIPYLKDHALYPKYNPKLYPSLVKYMLEIVNISESGEPHYKS